jgi:uncharacterized MAPEG superfamily protein
MIWITRYELIIPPCRRRSPRLNRTRQVKSRIIRAEAAFANGLETISLYAAAVASVNIAPVSPVVANILAIVYLATRVLYNVVYVILQDDPRWALARSATWFSGIGVVFAMFSLAGTAVY